MWKISVPLAVVIGKKGRKIALNLNTYRNLHFHESNDAKVTFKGLVEPQLQGIPLQQGIALRYELYGPTAARRDLMNVVSVVDKFFSDVLPEVGIITDDNAEIIPQVEAFYRGIDRTNPRVDVTIYPLGTQPQPAVPNQTVAPVKGCPNMALQLTIGQAAIEAALRAYIARNYKTLPLSLIAGRGENGFSFNMSEQHDTVIQAVREAVGIQLPGLDLTIELHATRGPEGFTATITAPVSLDPDTILGGTAAPVSHTPLLAQPEAPAPEEPIGEDEVVEEVAPEPQPVTQEQVKPPKDDTPNPFRRKKEPAAVVPSDNSHVEDVPEEAPETEPAEGNKIDPAQAAGGFEDEDEWEGGLPPETPSGITSNEDEPVDKPVMEEAPLNPFRRAKSAERISEASTAPAGGGKPNAIFANMKRNNNQ